jgi:uncharacterized protein
LIGGQGWPTVAFLFAVAFIAGLSRGFSGFGAALIFIPLGSAAVGPALAAPILLAIDAVGAAPMLPNAWGLADRRTVLMMVAGAALAVPAGAAALRWVDPVSLRWVISGVILVLAMLLMSGWRYTGRPLTRVTVGVGIVSGLLNGSAQIGGPPVVAYWLGSGASAPVVRANIVLFFACSTVISVLTYAVAGLFGQSMAWLSLAAGPAYLAGTMLGMRMFGLARPETFRRISYALIALAAILGLPIVRWD